MGDHRVGEYTYSFSDVETEWEPPNISQAPYWIIAYFQVVNRPHHPLDGSDGVRDYALDCFVAWLRIVKGFDVVGKLWKKDSHTAWYGPFNTPQNSNSHRYLVRLERRRYV
jgi:hypothetical protein